MSVPNAITEGNVVRNILALLAPTPVKQELALRQAFMCCLTLVVVQLYGLSSPALTVYLIFFLTKPDRVSSLSADIDWVVLYTAIFAIILIFSMFTLNRPIARVFAMAIFSCAIIFLRNSTKLDSSAPPIAFMLDFILDSLTAESDGEEALRKILYSWLSYTIPTGIAFCVNMLAAPSPRRLAGQLIAEQLCFSAACIQDRNAFDLNRFEDLSLKASEVQNLLKLADKAKTSPTEELLALKKASLSSHEILVLTFLAHQNPEELLPENFRRYISSNLFEMAKIMETGSYPVDIDLKPASGKLTPISRNIADKLIETINDFAVVDAHTAECFAPKTEKIPFFRKDAFSNPEHVRFALKTTAAGMFCYFTYSLLDWPGIHTCMITCYVVALGTTAETVEKLSLRIAGCLVGAAMGLVCLLFIIPHITSIASLIVVVFFATALASWVAHSGPRISYAGIQIALAFLMMVVQSSAPSFDLTIARDRIIGILFGNIAIYIVFTNFWPQTVSNRIDSAMASVLRKTGQLILIKDRVNRMILLLSLQAELIKVMQDISIARYEPLEIRVTKEWVENRRQLANAVLVLQCPVYWLANEKISFNHHIAKHFDMDAEILEKVDSTAIFWARKQFAIDYPHLGRRIPFAAWLNDDLIVPQLAKIEKNIEERPRPQLMSCIESYGSV